MSSIGHDSTDTDKPEHKPVEEIIREHRHIFETVAEEVSDPYIAEKYGQRPLEYLKQADAEKAGGRK